MEFNCEQSGNSTMLLSVIIPVFNVKAYLYKCVDSVLQQTYKNIEAVLVDDGSTDGCAEICDEYAKKDSRIKVIHKTNGGLPSAWKIGVEKCSGDYVGFVDSDDFVDSDYFEKLIKAIMREQTDIAISGYTVDYSDGTDSSRIRPLPYLLSDMYAGEKLQELKSNFFSRDSSTFRARWLKVIKRDLVINNLSFVDEKITVGEDVGITLATLFDAQKIVIIDSFGYHYVQRRNSIMNSASGNSTSKVVSNYEQLCKNIETVCFSKGVVKNIEMEYASQLAVTISKIVRSKNEKMTKLNGLKMLRGSEYAKKALKGSFANLPFRQRIALRLFYAKLYSVLLLIGSIG